MIFAFSYPHKIGSVCLRPCKQCNEREGVYGLTFASEIDTPVADPPAMKILRKSTEEEWRTWCIEVGGVRFEDTVVTGKMWFYEVSAD